MELADNYLNGIGFKKLLPQLSQSTPRDDTLDVIFFLKWQVIRLNLQIMLHLTMWETLVVVPL